MDNITKELHKYIEQKKGVCGGTPIIKNTRIRVIDIVIEYELLGYTPYEIIEAHPQLNLQQIHDVLSYYYENREGIDNEIENRQEYIREAQKKFRSVIPE